MSSSAEFAAPGAYVVSGAPRQGEKRKMTSQEGIQKVKRTIGWYNHNGGLSEQIIYKNIRDTIEAIDPREALKILKGLEDKAGTIRNPTAWVQKAAENVGPELDMKVKKTIAWYNKHGGLAEDIRYDEVRGLLCCMPPKDACSLLKSLDGKGQEILKPTAYICKAAQKKLERGGSFGGSSWHQNQQQVEVAFAVGGLGPKVRKTINWYNKNGNLQQEINYTEVEPALTQVGDAAALQILKGLDGKGHEVRNPNAWLTKAAMKMIS